MSEPTYTDSVPASDEVGDEVEKWILEARRLCAEDELPRAGINYGPGEMSEEQYRALKVVTDMLEREHQARVEAEVKLAWLGTIQCRKCPATIADAVNGISGAGYCQNCYQELEARLTPTLEMNAERRGYKQALTDVVRMVRIITEGPSKMKNPFDENDPAQRAFLRGHATACELISLDVSLAQIRELSPAVEKG